MDINLEALYSRMADRAVRNAKPAKDDMPPHLSVATMVIMALEKDLHNYTDIAKFCGRSRERVYRVCCEMAEHGLIAVKKSIVVKHGQGRREHTISLPQGRPRGPRGAMK